MDRRVDRRAAVAFLAEEIFDTRDRTGVLIFVSEAGKRFVDYVDLVPLEGGRFNRN